MADRFLFAAFLTLVTFVGIRPPAMASERANLVLLEEFFLGKTSGRGYFKSWVAGVHRPFSVKTRGTMRGDTLTLVEDFVYDDGERDRKTWKFTRTGYNTFEGTREDVVGKAKIKIYEDRITLKYLVDIPNNGKKTRVRFSDILSRQVDGTIRNVANVYKFGIKIGRVDLTFKR